MVKAFRFKAIKIEGGSVQPPFPPPQLQVRQKETTIEVNKLYFGPLVKIEV